MSEQFWLDEARDASGRWVLGSSEAHTHATTIIRGKGHGKSFDTQQLHTDAKGRYSPQRARLHAAIVNHFLAGSKPQASPEALFTAGGAASGKSALAGRASDPHMNMPVPRGHVYINPDDIKKFLPEYAALGELGKGELSAPATHEESSDIAKLLVAIAMKQKRHIVVDGTGDTKVGKFGDKIRAAQAQGYRTHVRYAHIPVDTAIERERLRAAKTGRKVPEDVLREQHRTVSQGFSEDVRHIPNLHIEVVSTAGRGRPTLIAEKKPRGQMQVAHGPRYKEMLDKANQ